MKSINKNIDKSLEMAKKLIFLADKGEMASKDDGCVLLYSIIRDCAYKIRMKAESERDTHRRTGIWR